MAPFIFNVTCPPFDEATTKEPPDLGKDDLNALLYIVVTLLFYSMGIIIGIITYLKREQQDMAEDQVFDLYLSFKQEPFNMHKRERVQQMAVYLKQIEEAKLAREKIEAWSAEQTQKPKSSGTDGGKIAPTYGASFSFPGASCAVVGADKGHGTGASALLCSLTLGVCEPLLAPEGTIPKSTVTNHANIPGLFPTFSKGKARGPRHSVPSMNIPNVTGQGIMRKNQRSCHEKRSGFLFPSRKKGYNPQIELADLKRFRFERDLSACQDESNDDFISDDDLDLELFKSSEMDKSFPMPSLRDNENVPAFKRAAYASEKRKNKTIRPETMSFDKDSDYPDDDSSHPSNTDRDDSRDLESVENEPCSVIITRDSSKSDLSLHTNVKLSDNTQSKDNIDSINEPTVTLDTPSDNDVFMKKHSLCEPLTLDKTLLRPFSDTAATPAPKSKLVTNSLTNIPRDTTHIDGLSVHTAAVSPRYDSWRKRGAKTVDIPDSKMLQPRSKADKQPQGRNRRGALLFTQKSLHHIENEDPRPGSAKRVLGYQESTDSYSSRNTDSTDVAESPQLQPAFDRSQGPSSDDASSKPQTSHGVAARRHERRIPKLVRSQTVDSSKSPPL